MRLSIALILLYQFSLVTAPKVAAASDAPAADAHGEAPKEAAAPAADAHGAPAAPAAPAPKPGDNALTSSKKNPYALATCKVYCPKDIIAPDISFAAEQMGEPWNYPMFRYSLVIVLASWNARSTEIVNIIKQHIPEFKRRRIGVLGLASHDTAPETLRWSQDYRPGFKVAQTTFEFIKKELNPKVPTVWIADTYGHMTHRVELPTDVEVKQMVEWLYQWTDF